MPLAIANRVKETTTTTGTGTLTLNGAPNASFQTFAAGVGGGNSCYYCISDGSNFEIGIGTVTDGTPDTLSRDTVLESSNADAKVNWGAGTRDVFVVAPAEKIATKDIANTFSAPQSFAATQTMIGASIIEANASVAAHATTANIWAGGNYVTLTGGAVTFTDVADAPQAGAEVEVYCNAAHVFTDNANLEIDGDANFTAEAGDRVLFRAKSTTVFTLHPRKKTGAAVAGAAADTPRSYLAGYGLANNGTDPTNDIDIAVGTARDSTNAATITLASALVKQLDVAWAVGTNQGMLDTGAVGNNTYHVFAIRRPDTGVVDILASLSATAPTMPTNYTQFRRIGSIIRAAGAILAFAQTGDEFLLNAVTLDISAANPGTSAVLRTLVVPTGITVGAIFNWNLNNTGNTNYPFVRFSSPLVSDQAVSHTAAALADGGGLITNNGANIPGWKIVTTNTSAQVRSRLGYSDATVTLYMATLGWIDRRGRDA